MPRPKKSNRADGRFELKRTIGHDENGKAVRKSFYGANEAEAQREYHLFLEQREKEKQERICTPFGSWVDTWLYTYKEPDVKPTTFLTTYKRPCERYIKPYFAGKALQEIYQADIKAFLNTLTATCSQSTLDKIIICLRGIFEAAIDNDRLSKNPCRNITAKSKKEQAKKRTYDKETADALCRSDHKYALYVHILLRLGLRCSELCGLKWGDIDFNTGKIAVSRALTTEGGLTYIDKPKSANSTRKLDVPQDLLERLAAYRNPKGGFIAMLNGHHITPDHFGDRQLEAFYNYHKIPREQRLTPHELRHTCGTLLYQSTKDIYFVSRFLGHSDIGITTKIYVHSSMQDDAIHIEFTEANTQ